MCGTCGRLNVNSRHSLLCLMIRDGFFRRFNARVDWNFNNDAALRVDFMAQKLEKCSTDDGLIRLTGGRE